MNKALIAAIFSALTAFAQLSDVRAQDGPPQLILNPDTVDELAIPLADKRVSIDPATGNLKVFPEDPLVCTEIGNSCTGTATVQVDPLALTPSEVEPGGAFTASLGSRGAWECRRTGLAGTSWNTEYGVPINRSRQQPVGADIAPGVYTLVHECRNGGDPERATAKLTVVEPTPSDGGNDPAPLPVSCEGVLRPSHWVRDTTAIAQSSATTFTWLSAFGAEFPSTLNGKGLAVNKDRYAALRFDPRGAPAGTTKELVFGELAVSQRGGIGQTAPTVSISACPGDFRPELGNCLQDPPSFGVFRWTNKSGGDGSACQLPEADTLYLNITYAISNEDPSKLFWWCGGEDECGHFVK